MITLYLIENRIIDRPILCLSDFFEKHKGLYYDYLTAVRRKSDLMQWIKFFLEAVNQTCEAAANNLKRIMELRRDCEGNRIIHLGRRAPNAKKLLDHLFTQPMVDAQDIAIQLHVSTVSAYKIIDDFLRLGILQSTSEFKRNRFFLLS